MKGSPNLQRLIAKVFRLKIGPGVPQSRRPFETWEDLRLLRGLDRIDYDAAGVPRRRYTAIDPAVHLVRCTCGKADCWSNELVTLREHMAVLYRAILVCGNEGAFADQPPSVFTWPGVTEALQMAASIDDVFADPSYSDDSEAAQWCRPAYERDQEDREVASKYAAALTTFNFVWNAYERTIELSLGDAFAGDKAAARARKVLNQEPELAAQIPSLNAYHGFARKMCLKNEALADEIRKKENAYEMNLAAKAAELCRIFRNHIVHGKDGTPTSHAGWACARIYATTRVTLVLIQLLILRRVTPGVLVNSSVNADEEEEARVSAETYIANLHRRMERWWPAGPELEPKLVG